MLVENKHTALKFHIDSELMLCRSDEGRKKKTKSSTVIQEMVYRELSQLKIRLQQISVRTADSVGLHIHEAAD